MRVIREVLTLVAVLLLFSFPLYAKENKASSKSLIEVSGEVIGFHIATPNEEKLIAKYFAEQYTPEDRAFEKVNQVAPPTLRIAAVTFDKFGAKGYLVVFDSVLYCGSIGCGLAIVLEKEGQWKKVGTGVYNEKPMARLKDKTNGFYDLIVGGTRMVWNGKAYVDMRGAETQRLSQAGDYEPVFHPTNEGEQEFYNHIFVLLSKDTSLAEDGSPLLFKISQAASVDLNEDGENEVITFMEPGDCCGYRGFFTVLKKNKERWISIGGAENDYGKVIIYSHKTRGMYDMRFGAQRLVWNGRGYIVK